jgi:hypothetical protein
MMKMVLEIKADIPSTPKINRAAEQVYNLRERYVPDGIVTAYLIGHGGQRDWHSGIGRVFSSYFSMGEVSVSQEDPIRAGGYRPLTDLRKLGGVDFGIIFDTSTKGYMHAMPGKIFLPASPGLSGALLSILMSRHIPPYLTTVVTHDELGVASIPIEHDYIGKGRTHIGTRRFLALNLISTELAASLIDMNTDTREIERMIRGGVIEPDRLRQYERHLTKVGKWSRETSLEGVILPALDRIVEPGDPINNSNFVLTVGDVLKHAR